MADWSVILNHVLVQEQRQRPSDKWFFSALFSSTVGETGQFLHQQKQKVMKCLEEVDFLSPRRKGWCCPQLRKECWLKLPFLKIVKKVLNEAQAEPPRCFFFLVSRQYMLYKQQDTFSHVRIYYKCSTNTFTDSSKSISTTVERILIMFLLHRATFIASYCTLSFWLPINVGNNNNCPQYIVKTSVIKWKY